MSSNKIPGNVESKECDLKCQYIMYYVNDKYSIANANNSLILTPTIHGSKSVSYASENYTLQNLKIISAPQAHMFSGSVIGEIIINHIKMNSQTELNVCIPIQLGSTNSIINEIITSAPSSTSNSTTSPEFSIMKIIPDNTFYNYTSVNNKINIVFDSANAITITQETFNTLNLLFTPASTTSSITPNDYLYNELFKSLNPPINGNLANDIVIDCTAIDDGTYEDALINKHNALPSGGGSIISPEAVTFLWTILTILIIVALFAGVTSMLYGADTVA
jgi:hypothetical protein